MPNTYSQIYIQIVFAINYRMSLISPAWKERLHRYISGIVTLQGHKLIAINSTRDHIHILAGLKPHVAPSDLVRDIKRNSTIFVNENRLAAGKFAWQEGFGAFSYSHSQISRVARYIEHQEEHHRRLSFAEEYKLMLKSFHIDYDERYVLDR